MSYYVTLQLDMSSTYMQKMSPDYIRYVMKLIRWNPPLHTVRMK